MRISDWSSDVCSSDLHYFGQSEQIPSLIRLAARHDPEAGCLAGGLLLQHLPEGEVGRDRLHVRHDNPEWDHAKAIASTLKDEELTDPATSLETLAWRLFHEEDRKSTRLNSSH